MVMNDQGRLTGDEKEIRRQFLRYFKNLYCSQATGLTNGDEEAHVNRVREEVFCEIQQSPKSTIPPSAHYKLLATPTMQELKETLFSMGPDRSPGPDGITARFLQVGWNTLKTDLLTQIKEIFEAGEVPQEWLNCRVTLIPKSKEPQTPADYRPISVGNILYRLTMKMIANRLRPFLKEVISQEQNAFIKGRSIAENIILVKELLHSFSQSDFKQRAFLLKADVNKAFDKLSWDFLERALRYLNVPERFIQLLISSYKRAKVTIMINGNGDGFLEPTQGLRQGCPMSPYVFIIALEVLSRMLHMARNRGDLKGVKVASSSPIFTHAIYADDLVLMGDTSQAELDVLTNIMHKFGFVSGLNINPTKSRLWFSKSCDEHIVGRVQRAWNATSVQGAERYLGVMLGTRGDAKMNGLMLLEKIKAKLSGWKSNMLSHAGRLVLIKSVLMTMPVYYMSIEILPKGIIKEINSLMAKFFWGKTGHSRYLSFISWKKLCQPVSSGGLGLKDLQSFGEAIFFKIVWALMAEVEKPWVQLCKAKYYPKVGYWRARSGNKGSKMWRQVMGHRNFFKEKVMWQLGNGHKTYALSQPWFLGWMVQEQASRFDRTLRVKDLVDAHNGQWEFQTLARLFQPTQVQNIIHGVSIPNLNDTREDRLIWKCAKNGNYSPKEGYRELMQAQQNMTVQHQGMWERIWHCKNILPKIKIFLWRLINRGLPLAVNMHKRFQNFSPQCQRCHEENEFEMHCMFFCHTSRQVWFGSQLGIRTHELPLDISMAMQQIFEMLNEDAIQIFSNTIWEIWKERNKTVIEQKEFKVNEVLQRTRVLYNPMRLGQLPSGQSGRKETELQEVASEGWQVLVDASWDVSCRAGCAYIIYAQGILHSVGMQAHQLQDSFMAETMALHEAITHVYGMEGVSLDTTVQFFSDCMNLVQAVNHRELDELPSWEARGLVQDIINRLDERQQRITLQHARREAVVQAHNLANAARRTKFNFRGKPNWLMQQHEGISNELNTCFFQRVQEHPL
ncbi:RNA-directed DNA polymerase (reverse transcriptase)-related family protein [Rhynchospora pubera]|uniref:RNA-directed DNA polymerase (Reverse transcriptase)-related family protein n=1 Tax=Rhynchospora pubera TaxID=906938 RepID=A0AAV8H4S0_9POAL|nr:RNA-directed DNA polymerase (reverse transcriptase)-related family protein [Rhynchospora pubera]